MLKIQRLKINRSNSVPAKLLYKPTHLLRKCIICIGGTTAWANLVLAQANGTRINNVYIC